MIDVDRKEFKARNEIKRLQNILDYKKTIWEVKYMKSAKTKLPLRDWARTGEQTKHVFHETREAAQKGLTGIKYSLPRTTTYGIKRGYSLPKANLRKRDD